MRLAASERSHVTTLLLMATAAGVLMSVVGCEFETSIRANSSEGDNDYFEEPLDGWESEFEPALDVSNRFIDLFSDGEIEEIYSLFHKRLRSKVSIEELKALREQVFDAWGPVVEYKPMQWGFATGFENGEDVIYSTKIVVHEDSSGFYILAFPDDGAYREILGFNIRPRNGNERVTEALEAVLAGG